MKTLVRFTSLILMAGVLSSCYYTRLKTPATVVDDQKFGYLKPAEKMSMMNYDFIGSRILKPRCIACHDSSKNVSLETYDLVKSNLLKIKNAVFIEESMPKRGRLTDEEKRLLWNWILLDAPFQSEQTPPQEEPMVATYDSIRMHIFEPICSTCHNPDGTGKRVLLDKLYELLKTHGWYIEASAKLEDICRTKGFNFVDDPEKVKQLISGHKSKTMQWIGNGYYTRDLTNSNVKIKKRIYGLPN